MPVRPQPWQVRCTQCGWSKRHHPHSDSLNENDRPPRQCPKCGHEPLERTKADNDILSSLMQRLLPK